MMSRAFFILLLCLSVTLPVPVLGVDEVKINGILSINNVYTGTDGYILFPDGTTQSTAKLPRGIK
jgi:hypothetical protein